MPVVPVKARIGLEGPPAFSAGLAPSPSQAPDPPVPSEARNGREERWDKQWGNAAFGYGKA